MTDLTDPKHVDLISRADGFRLGTKPTDDDVDRANMLITDLTATLRALAEERDVLHNAGIAEIAARNPSVMEYMKHWEGRAETAEAERDAIQDQALALITAVEAAWQPQGGRDALREALRRALTMRTMIETTEGQADATD